MDIRNIFGKKASPPIEGEPQIKRIVLRGPNGKFIGKKKPWPGKPPILKSSTFSGIPIRRFYTRNKCFFCIEDVVALTGAPDIKEYLKQIKSKNKELQKDWKKMIEKFDYQAEDKTELLECAEAENILKIVLALDKSLPGPFSRWLRETAQKIPA